MRGSCTREAERGGPNRLGSLWASLIMAHPWSRLRRSDSSQSRPPVFMLLINKYISHFFQDSQEIVSAEADYNQIGQDIGGSVDVINFYDIKFLSALILIPYL